MIDLKKFILDLVNKAGIAVENGSEDAVVQQILPTLDEYINLHLAMKVSKKDQEVMKGMLMVSPETFNGYEFFKDKFKDLDKEIDMLLNVFSKEFLKNNK